MIEVPSTSVIYAYFGPLQDQINYVVDVRNVSDFDTWLNYCNLRTEFSNVGVSCLPFHSFQF